MKLYNMKSSNGKEVPNQFIMTEEGHGANGNFIKKEVFQSYKSIIAERITWDDSIDVTLDINCWDYSTTTGKYRNQFLGETKQETQKKIDSGEYKLTNLN